MSRQLTLALLKPDIASLPHKINQVQSVILKNELKILSKKRYEPNLNTHDIIQKFYSEHEGKFFYNRLVNYMKSGPFEAWILGGDNAIEKWRTLIGPAKIYKNQGFTENLRSLHGVSDTRNGFHGSDSTISAENEILSLDFKYKDLHNLITQTETPLVFVPELGLHLETIGSKNTGFCKNVSETLGYLSTWDRVYEHNSAPTEWFSTEMLNSVLFRWLEDAGVENRNSNILDIGCGKSELCNEIARKFKNTKIHAIDFSKVVIQERQALQLSHKGDALNVTFTHHDLLEDAEILKKKLNIENIDIVIDKATIDAILRQNNGEEICKLVIKNLLKLKPNYFINISDEAPEVRLDFLESIMPKKSEIEKESMLLNYQITFEDISSNQEFFTMNQHAGNTYFAYKIAFQY